MIRRTSSLRPLSNKLGSQFRRSVAAFSESCDVVQGPNLLRTSRARPDPGLLYLPGLRSLPFWTAPDYRRVAYGDPVVSHVVQHLEKNAEDMRQEYLTIAPTLPSDYEATDHPAPIVQEENDNSNTSLHHGKWDWHSYLNKGSVRGDFVFQFQKTGKVLQELRDDGLLFEGTPFGFTFFSTLHPGASIQSHTAPMNFRLRLHLPLLVPTVDETVTADGDMKDDDPTASLPCGIRVGPYVRPWTLNKALVLDDSYSHQVWNHTSEKRVVLLVDIWHPDVTHDEKLEIIELFQTARLQGLWKQR